MTRALTRLGVLVTLTIVVSIATSSPASAALLPDCKSSPVPDRPDRGMVGLLYPKPNPLPPSEDPFRAGARTSIYDQYGAAGLLFTTYDLGCGPGAARDPGAVVSNTVANWILDISKLIVGVIGTLAHVAYDPGYLSHFDTLIVLAVSTLQHGIFVVWAPVFLTFLGLWITWRARHARFALIMNAVAWSGIVAVVATVIFQWPVQAGHVADGTVSGVLGSVNAGMNGRPATQDPGSDTVGYLHDGILYRQWLRGTLGSETAPVARELGPDLFRASALTWREAAACDQSESRCREIIDGKERLYADTAAKIQARDEHAYLYLTGKRGDDRFGAAVVSLIAALVIAPFLLVAFLLMIGAYLIVRLAVMFLPVVATLGLYPTLLPLVRQLFTTVISAIINAILYGVGVAMFTAAVRLLLGHGSGISLGFGIPLLAILALVTWIALRPFKSLTRMVGTYDPFDATRDTKNQVKRYGKKALAWWTVGQALAPTVAAAAVRGATAATAQPSGGSPGASPRSEGWSGPSPSPRPGPAGELPSGEEEHPPGARDPVRTRDEAFVARERQTGDGVVYEIFDPGNEPNWPGDKRDDTGGR